MFRSHQNPNPKHAVSALTPSHTPPRSPPTLLSPVRLVLAPHDAVHRRRRARLGLARLAQRRPPRPVPYVQRMGVVQRHGGQAGAVRGEGQRLDAPIVPAGGREELGEGTDTARRVIWAERVLSQPRLGKRELKKYKPKYRYTRKRTWVGVYGKRETESRAPLDRGGGGVDTEYGLPFRFPDVAQSCCSGYRARPPPAAEPTQTDVTRDSTATTYRTP